MGKKWGGDMKNTGSVGSNELTKQMQVLEDNKNPGVEDILQCVKLIKDVEDVKYFRDIRAICTKEGIGDVGLLSDIKAAEFCVVYDDLQKQISAYGKNPSVKLVMTIIGRFYQAFALLDGMAVYTKVKPVMDAALLENIQKIVVEKNNLQPINSRFPDISKSIEQEMNQLKEYEKNEGKQGKKFSEVLDFISSDIEKLVNCEEKKILFYFVLGAGNVQWQKEPGFTKGYDHVHVVSMDMHYKCYDESVMMNKTDGKNSTVIKIPGCYGGVETILLQQFIDKGLPEKADVVMLDSTSVAGVNRALYDTYKKTERPVLYLTCVESSDLFSDGIPLTVVPKIQAPKAYDVNVYSIEAADSICLVNKGSIYNQTSEQVLGNLNVKSCLGELSKQNRASVEKSFSK
ncbi:hypothetical protein MIDIC_20066 [Alphaproteobacteria bacterium]